MLGMKASAMNQAVNLMNGGEGLPVLVLAARLRLTLSAIQPLP